VVPTCWAQQPKGDMHVTWVHSFGEVISRHLPRDMAPQPRGQASSLEGLEEFAPDLDAVHLPRCAAFALKHDETCLCVCSLICSSTAQVRCEGFLAFCLDVPRERNCC
jgi:hypothetical protein